MFSPHVLPFRGGVCVCVCAEEGWGGPGSGMGAWRCHHGQPLCLANAVTNLANAASKTSLETLLFAGVTNRCCFATTVRIVRVCICHKENTYVCT